MLSDVIRQVPPAWTVIESESFDLCSRVVEHLRAAIAVEMLPIIPAEKLKTADPKKPKPKDLSHLRVRDICNSLLHMLVHQLTIASSNGGKSSDAVNENEKDISYVLGNQLFDSAMEVC